MICGPSFRAREQQRFWPHALLSGGNATRRARQCGGGIGQPLPGRGVPMIDRIGKGVVSASPFLCTLTVRSVCFAHACKHRIAGRVPLHSAWLKNYNLDRAVLKVCWRSWSNQLLISLYNTSESLENAF